LKKRANKEDKKIYILQDSTFSIQRYESQLKMVKAFILDTAFKMTISRMAVRIEQNKPQSFIQQS
jgi:hypothetical protein